MSDKLNLTLVAVTAGTDVIIVLPITLTARWAGDSVLMLLMIIRW